MRTLHLYLLRQVIVALLMTVMVFTFVLLLGNALKEILTLLVNQLASFGTIFQAMGLLIPFVWVFALPLGMLTATLLVFGRFSADNELTAARASGLSLSSLVAPILVFSLMLCGLSAWVNLDLGPHCRDAYKDLLFNLKVDLSSAQLPEGRFIKEIKGYIFFIGKNKDGKLEDVRVFQLEHETNVVMSLRAERGSYQVNTTNREIMLELHHAKCLYLEGDRIFPVHGDVPISIKLDADENRARKPKLDNMSFKELLAELREVQQRSDVPQVAGLSEGDARLHEAEVRRTRSEAVSRIKVQIHRQVAFSFACFGFTLMGIPLGVRMHRRETNVGMGIALALAAVYYSMILMAESLDAHPELYPHLIVWLPNLLFQIGGGILLWRANRGG